MASIRTHLEEAGALDLDSLAAAPLEEALSLDAELVVVQCSEEALVEVPGVVEPLAEARLAAEPMAEVTPASHEAVGEGDWALLDVAERV